MTKETPKYETEPRINTGLSERVKAYEAKLKRQAWRDRVVKLDMVAAVLLLFFPPTITAVTRQANIGAPDGYTYILDFARDHFIDYTLLFAHFLVLGIITAGVFWLTRDREG